MDAAARTALGEALRDELDEWSAGTVAGWAPMSELIEDLLPLLVLASDLERLQGSVSDLAELEAFLTAGFVPLDLAGPQAESIAESHTKQRLPRPSTRGPSWAEASERFGTVFGEPAQPPVSDVGSPRTGVGAHRERRAVAGLPETALSTGAAPSTETTPSVETAAQAVTAASQPVEQADQELYRPISRNSTTGSRKAAAPRSEAREFSLESSRRREGEVPIEGKPGSGALHAESRISVPSRLPAENEPSSRESVQASGQVEVGRTTENKAHSHGAAYGTSPSEANGDGAAYPHDTRVAGRQPLPKPARPEDRSLVAQRVSPLAIGSPARASTRGLQRMATEPGLEMPTRPDGGQAAGDHPPRQSALAGTPGIDSRVGLDEEHGRYDPSPAPGIKTFTDLARRITTRHVGGIAAKPVGWIAAKPVGWIAAKQEGQDLSRVSERLEAAPDRSAPGEPMSDAATAEGAEVVPAVAGSPSVVAGSPSATRSIADTNRPMAKEPGEKEDSEADRYGSVDGRPSVGDADRPTVVSADADNTMQEPRWRAGDSPAGELFGQVLEGTRPGLASDHLSPDSPGPATFAASGRTSPRVASAWPPPGRASESAVADMSARLRVDGVCEERAGGADGQYVHDLDPTAAVPGSDMAEPAGSVFDLEDLLSALGRELEREYRRFYGGS